MAQIDENTNFEISIKAIISIGFAVFTLTTAFVTLDSRITSLEHGQIVQNMTIDKNSHFVTNWPLGNLGALPDDLIQNAEIMALKEKQIEVKELREDIRRLQLEVGTISAKEATIAEKIETLFDIWNQSVVNQAKDG